MSIMSRDFTTKEKVILLILILFLIVFAYFQFFERPMQKDLAKAEAEAAELQKEITESRALLQHLQSMQQEIDIVRAKNSSAYMPSYNNSKAELRLLNDILSSAVTYSVTFNNVTRNGNQIRRDFNLQFQALSYDDMNRIITRLTADENRCLIGDVRCNVGYDRYTKEDTLTVTAMATFYETMVGGVADAGLPADSTAS